MQVSKIFGNESYSKNVSFQKNINPIKVIQNNKKPLMLGLMLLAAANSPMIENRSLEIKNPQEIAKNDIVNTYGKYGKFYVSNTPILEDLCEHKECLNKINTLYKEIQGCSFNNPAIFNGLTLEELNEKVISPAQKLANGEKFGKNSNNLLFMMFENTCDSEGGFDVDLYKNTFNSQKSMVNGVEYQFDESFLKHYDNIFLMQPDAKQDTDKTLDTLFEKLEKSLEDGANLDIIFEGHGIGLAGVRFSTYFGLEKAMLDVTDFWPIEKGGNSFAQSMKNIFVKSIDDGHTPRIVGISCNSDSLQKAINNIMPENYKESVKVFGMPYNTFGETAIGFNDNSLEIITRTAPIKDNLGMLIKMTEKSQIAEDDNIVDTFLACENNGENAKNIIDNYKNGKNSGVLTKSSGVEMEYTIEDMSDIDFK